ncbi:hypothetical protein ACOME3_010526 [Neoechinorhynchus agilis]
MNRRNPTSNQSCRQRVAPAPHSQERGRTSPQDLPGPRRITSRRRVASTISLPLQQIPVPAPDAGVPDGRIAHVVRHDRRVVRPRQLTAIEDVIVEINWSAVSFIHHVNRNVKRILRECHVRARVVHMTSLSLRKLLMRTNHHEDQENCPKKCIMCTQCQLNNEGGCRRPKASCMMSDVVCRITCGNCKDQGKSCCYIGKTERRLHQRVTEHFCNARNQHAPSYASAPLATHFANHHNNVSPALGVGVLYRASDPVDLSIAEALLISRGGVTGSVAPTNALLNRKDELSDSLSLF